MRVNSLKSEWMSNEDLNKWMSECMSWWLPEK